MGFERSRETDGEKIYQPRIKPESQQTKLRSSPFSTLFTCANEATIRDWHNYMNNNETKGFFCFFIQQTDFFAYVISWKWTANQKQYYYRMMFFKTSLSAENKLGPSKYENRLKKRYTPVLHESLQLYIVYIMIVIL